MNRERCAILGEILSELVRERNGWSDDDGHSPRDASVPEPTSGVGPIAFTLSEVKETYNTQASPLASLVLPIIPELVSSIALSQASMGRIMTDKSRPDKSVTLERYLCVCILKSLALSRKQSIDEALARNGAPVAVARLLVEPSASNMSQVACVAFIKLMLSSPTSLCRESIAADVSDDGFFANFSKCLSGQLELPVGLRTTKAGPLVDLAAYVLRIEGENDAFVEASGRCLGWAAFKGDELTGFTAEWQAPWTHPPPTRPPRVAFGQGFSQGFGGGNASAAGMSKQLQIMQLLQRLSGRGGLSN